MISNECHQLEAVHLNRKKRKLKRLFNPNLKEVELKKNELTKEVLTILKLILYELENVVGIGSKVSVGIQYRDKITNEIYDEELSFLLVLDNDPRVKDTLIGISEETPIGKAIKGKRINETFEFGVFKNNFLVIEAMGKILKIEPPLKVGDKYSYEREELFTKVRSFQKTKPIRRYFYK